MNNPGLSFRISNESGNLIAYCFSQNCTLQSIADSIKVEQSAFFVGGGSRFGTHVPIIWTEQPVLDVMKLLPLEYDWDTQVELVFQTLDLDLEYADQGLSEMTKTDLYALVHIWLGPGYRPEMGDWWEYYDRIVRLMHELNRDTRTDANADVAAIPRGR